MPAAEAKHQQEEPAVEAYLCRIVNPSPRDRVIFDGIKNDKPIWIAKGQTVEAVLSDLTIGRLQEAEMINPEDPDLKVVEIGPPPAPPPPPQARARRARPAHLAPPARA